MLTEDTRERAAFDRDTADLYQGDPLAQVQQTLTILSRTAPQHGSYAKVLAICANEIEKARKVPNA